MPIEILYEDNHLLCANKPAGIPTQKTEGSSTSLEEELKQYIQKKYQKPGRIFLHAAHRIDKPVSGIVVFCKTSKSLERLSEHIREKSWKKTYLALVEGIPEKAARYIDFLEKQHQKAVLSKNGKKAELLLKNLASLNGISLLEIVPITGRFHQIRAQLAIKHYPILGDTKYNSTYAFIGQNIALHHRILSFTHPVTKEPLILIAPVPENWKTYGFSSYYDQIS